MKPFDLEAAKRGEPIQTRDGRPAKFIAHAPDSSYRSSKVACIVSGNFYLFCESGTWLEGSSQHANDLFMVSKKRTVWVNLYAIEGYPHKLESFAYANKVIADQFCRGDRIGGKAWPLEIEE